MVRLPCLPPSIPIRPFTGRHPFGGFEVVSRVVRYREQRCLAHALWDTQSCRRFLLVAQMQRRPCGPHSTSTKCQHQRSRGRQDAGIGSRSRALGHRCLNTGKDAHRDVVPMLRAIRRRRDQARVRLADLRLPLGGIHFHIRSRVEDSMRRPLSGISDHDEVRAGAPPQTSTPMACACRTWAGIITVHMNDHSSTHAAFVGASTRLPRVRSKVVMSASPTVP
jgi:hypothetical protein